MNGSSGQPNPKQNKVQELLMRYRVVIMLLGIMVIVLTFVYVFSNGMQAVASANVPSEEKCQKLGQGVDMATQKYAKAYWCEYNETGWHFNKTWFRESMQVVT